MGKTRDSLSNFLKVTCDYGVPFCENTLPDVTTDDSKTARPDTSTNKDS